MARRRIWNPITLLRRRLQRIERQSASRHRSRWTKAADWSLLLSMPIGLLLSLFLDANISRTSSEKLADLRLGRDGRGAPLTARILREDPNRTPWNFGSPLATVQLRQRTIEHGWPFSGWTTLPPLELLAVPLADPSVQIDLAAPSAVAQLETLQSDTGVDLTDALDVLLQTLDADRQQAWVENLTQQETRTSRAWSATLATAVATWFLLFLISILMIRTTQILYFFVSRWQRRRVIGKLKAGHCPFCNYDLSGVRYPKKCSECGRKIWG
ncbi:MAG: hypothetical protein QMB94_02230 [Phycisphaerales bacterium]